MTNEQRKQILANAPDGAESVSLVGHYIKAPFNNAFLYSMNEKEWLRTDTSIFCQSSLLSDLRAIVERDERIAELKAFIRRNRYNIKQNEGDGTQRYIDKLLGGYS